MTKEHTLAFQKTKDILTSDKVIAYFRPGAPLQLFTNASLKNGLGFHLKQQQPDHSWKTIKTGSRTLTSAETRYAPIELELQAIIYATPFWRVQLLNCSPIIAVWLTFATNGNLSL